MTKGEEQMNKRDRKLLELALAGGTDGDLALQEQIQELEDKFDLTVEEIRKAVPDMKEVVKSIKGIDGKDGESIVGPIGPQGIEGPAGEAIIGPQGPPGRDGRDSTIPGPQGPAGRDGQSVIGLPGRDGKDGSSDTPDQVIEKVNTSTLQIKKERVEGLQQAIENGAANALSVGITTPVIFANGTQVGRAKNSNYIGATVKITGDTANITTSSGLTVTEVDGSPSVANPTSIKFSNGSVTDNGDGTVTVTTGAGGGGDFSSNTSSSVDSEIVLFSGTGGKTGKRATGTGVATITSGVLGSFNFADEETPTDSGDQTSFTLAHTPLSGTTKLYRGGTRQQLGAGKDYTISGGTITLSSALLTGEILLIDYRY